MVNVKVTIKSIETDPTGQMVTLIVDAVINDQVHEISFGEMVGNLRGLTNEQVKDRLKGIFQDVVRQKIGMLEELNPQKKWKRTQAFVGKTFTIEV